MSFYGVRGIGSVYYLGYASTHVEFIDEGPLWAVVAFNDLRLHGHSRLTARR